MQTTLTHLIDHGLALREKLLEIAFDLENIEAAIREAAIHGSPHIDLKDPDRDGRQFLARGTQYTVPVILTADLLTQSFQENSVLHGRAQAIAGDHLSDLYKAVTTHKMIPKSGKAFRREAAALLGPQKSAELITAITARDKYGIPKSTTKIEWDQKSPNEQEGAA